MNETCKTQIELSPVENTKNQLDECLDSLNTTTNQLEDRLVSVSNRSEEKEPEDERKKIIGERYVCPLIVYLEGVIKKVKALEDKIEKMADRLQI